MPLAQPYKLKQANMKENDEPSEHPRFHGLDLRGHGITTISADLFSYTFITTLHLDSNLLKEIPPEIISLKSLTTLTISNNKLTNVPSFISKCVCLRTLDLSNNNITSLPVELGSLNLTSLSLEGNPLVEPYSGIFNVGGWSSIMNLLRDGHCEYGPPVDRLWITLDENSTMYTQFNVLNDNKCNKLYGSDSLNKTVSDEIFSIGSYNILSNTYATPSHFYYVPTWALSWKYRQERLTTQILARNFDILGLQEVETQEYSNFFRPHFLTSLNYESTFYPKTRAKTTGCNPGIVDGCATFWKKNKYKLIGQRFVEFATLINSDDRWMGNFEVLGRNCSKDNIALITVLEVKDQNYKESDINVKYYTDDLKAQKPLANKMNKILIIVNVHLTWDPQYKDVKLTQSIILAEEVKKVKEKYKEAALFLIGDFNSTRNSGVYEFFTNGRIKKNHDDFGVFNYSSFLKDGVENDLALNDTYKYNGKNEAKLLTFTNYTPSFTGVLDYIFHNQIVENVSFLGKIDEEYTDKIVGLPSIHLPSDHIIIAGKYRFINKKNVR